MTNVTFEAGRRLATSTKIKLHELERKKYLRKADSLFMTNVTFEAGRRLATSTKIKLNELERKKYLRKAEFLAGNSR